MGSAVRCEGCVGMQGRAMRGGGRGAAGPAAAGQRGGKGISESGLRVGKLLCSVSEMN